MENQAHRGYFADQMQAAKAAVAQGKKARGQVLLARPRLLLAGLAADSGTTAVHLALLAGLKRAGETTQPFHAAASEQEAVLQAYVSGRRPYVLDDWLMDRDSLRFLLIKHGEDCRLSTLEGAGGFFDGLYAHEAARLGEKGKNLPLGSAASLARSLDCPVVLVLRPRGSKQSVWAELRGYLDWYASADARRKEGGGIRGLIFNEVSEQAYLELRAYVEEQSGLRVLGYLPPLPPFSLKLSRSAIGDPQSRVWEQLRGAIDVLAEAGKDSLDFAGLLELADGAPALPHECPGGLLRVQRESQALGPVNIALALDRCFFSYPQDNLELLAESGAKLRPFSPLEDEILPKDTDALYIGGLYCPERLALLSHRGRMGRLLRHYVEQGLPVWAEGQGAVYLSGAYQDAEGLRWAMAGVLPYDAVSPYTPKDSPYAARALTLVTEMEGLGGGEAQTPDLNNPRGISTWQVPYCKIESRVEGLLLQSGQRLRALGDGAFTRFRQCADFKMATTREREFTTGINRASIHALDARIFLYGNPELTLRFMRAARRYREQREQRELR